MNPTQDPSILAAGALEDASAYLDDAIKNRDRGKIAVAEKRVDIAENAFAAAQPTTPAGIRRKTVAVTQLLGVCEAGDSLTPEGAAYIRRQVESTLAGLIRPRLVT